jgi:hypothetical protein
MYIILGILTFVWGIPLLLFLPDSIEKASFLTEEERKYAADRVVIAGTGRTSNAGYKVDQIVECPNDSPPHPPPPNTYPLHSSPTAPSHSY